MASGSDRTMRFQVVTAWDGVPQEQAPTWVLACAMAEEIKKRYPEPYSGWVWVVDTQEQLHLATL
jgi:hypothetical protein